MRFPQNAWPFSPHAAHSIDNRSNKDVPPGSQHTHVDVIAVVVVDDDDVDNTTPSTTGVVVVVEEEEVLSSLFPPPFLC